MPATLVPDGQVHARAGGGDGPGEVPAQAGVIGLVDQPEAVEDASGDPEVHGVDRCGSDLDPDLAGPGLATGTSMISIESGPPGVRTTAVRKVVVFMVSLLLLDCSFHSTMVG